MTEADVDTLLADIAGLWALLWPALIIALLRIGDVTLNVCRTLFVVQQRRMLAALTAGVEASVWLAAAGIVFAELTPIRVAGFVVGVATGTALGVTIAQKLRLGMTTVRIYADALRADDTGKPLGDAIAAAIREAGHGATVFRGSGLAGPVDMVLSTVRRREAEDVVRIARTIDPATFAAVDNSLHPAPTIMGGPIARV